MTDGPAQPVDCRTVLREQLRPDLFRALATVYAELAERWVAETPEDVRDDLPLADVLDRLSAEGGAPAAAADPSRDA